eukprot:CAMPEP_0184671430 /NCGR_PEP_ID=MMETSP0308-20130426/85497_1 /TAXON_ID=38269 /ORGANISM="Gloeochaete witrockiana, Strain SAG 46.84" /LENGTH=611 /DNA_ID=CAMNT_0027118557 /DNA_START=80 /DNA_END=1916 /DNA_ORIENTATION=-
MAPQILSVLVNNAKTVPVELSHPSTVSGIVDVLCATFPVSLDSPWTLSYVDNEGDRIRIQHDVELKAFLETSSALLHASNDHVNFEAPAPSNDNEDNDNNDELQTLMNLLNSQSLNLHPTCLTTERNADGNVTVYLDCNVDELPHGFRADIPIAVQSGRVAPSVCPFLASKSSSSSSSSSSLSTEHVHNAFCDICNSTIVGIRYKCVNCADFDLCAGCEATWRQKEAHDLSHFFLKIHTALPCDWTKRIHKPHHFAKAGGRCMRRGGHKQMLIERLNSIEERLRNLEQPKSSEATVPVSEPTVVAAPAEATPSPSSAVAEAEANEKRARLEYLARRRTESLIAMAKRQAEERARCEAEERARCEAEERAAREAEERAVRQAEEKARCEAEARAAREAQLRAAHAAREADIRAAREAAAAHEAQLRAEARAAREAQLRAAHAAREADIRAAREAEEKAKREAEERAARDEALRAAYAVREAQLRAARELEALAARQAEERAAREAEARVAREASEKAALEKAAIDNAARLSWAGTVARPVSSTLIPSAGPVAVAAPVVDPEVIRYARLREVYASELQQLSSMGFRISERELIDLIDKHRDISEVVIQLLDRV